MTGPGLPELERAYHEALRAERIVSDDCRRRLQDATRATEAAFRAWRAAHERAARQFAASLERGA